MRQQEVQPPWLVVLGSLLLGTGPFSVAICSLSAAEARRSEVANPYEPTTENQEVSTKNEGRRTKEEGQRANMPQRRVLVSIPDKKLAVVEDGRVLKVYPIAVGASSSPTPTGQMRIISKLIAPTYYHHGQIIPPGKSNPLGSRWLGLSKSGYGIHGTNVPSSIGKAASHGCIRMRKRDLEELFALVQVDDVVEIDAKRDAWWTKTFEGARAMADSAPAPAVQAEPQSSPIAVVAMSGQF